MLLRYSQSSSVAGILKRESSNHLYIFSYEKFWINILSPRVIILWNALGQCRMSLLIQPDYTLVYNKTLHYGYLFSGFADKWIWLVRFGLFERIVLWYTSENT